MNRRNHSFEMNGRWAGITIEVVIVADVVSWWVSAQENQILESDE